MKINNLSPYLDPPLNFLELNKSNLDKITNFWITSYKGFYPNYKINYDDPINNNSHIIYTSNQKNIIQSSARLTLDGPLGLPAENNLPSHINEYRNDSLKVSEFGRLINTTADQSLVRNYYKHIYKIAQLEDIDVVVLIIPEKKIKFHKNIIGAKLLITDTQIDTGGKYNMACMAWHVKETSNTFYQWINK